MKHVLPITVILILGLIGIGALFAPGLFTAHDIWHQVARFYHYQKALSDGQFPPYWIGTMAHGLGYPLFFSSYHLPWILGIPIYKVTSDIPLTIKTLFVISYLFSGIFMYLFSWELFKNRSAAFLSTTIYLWAPYRFVTILVSAAMGTAFVFTFLPLLLWGILKTARENSRLSRVTIALSTASIILSHLMTVPFIAPLLLLFTALVIRQYPKNANQIVKFLLIGVGLSAFYLVPAVYYARFTQVAAGAFKYLYQQNFVSLHQLVYSKWGYGISQYAKEGAISYQVGIAQWLAFATAIFLALTTKTRNKQTILFCLIFIGSVLAMLELSRPVWDIVNRLVTLDYPTAFLLPAVFSGSMLAASVYTLCAPKVRLLFLVLMVAIALYTNRNHLRVNEYTNFPVSLYVESEPTTNSYDEYLPKGVNLPEVGKESNLTVSPETVKVSNLYQNTKELTFMASVPETMQVSVRQFVFPGVNLYVDNKKAPFGADPLGRVNFSASAGEHNIAVKIEETLLVKISKLVSVGAVMLLILWSGNAKTT